MDEFFANGRIGKGCNSSFIVLIPKKEGARELNHFRPISLIGCLYKVVAKVLARRIRPVMGKLIGDAQSAFLPGRNIMDGIAILNEVIEDAKRKNTRRIVFKVDFAKAYDSMEWDFLMDMMARMNFPRKWRDWILECVSSATANVLVNGSPSGEFRLERGVRQGDPLSPFLFLITAEGLNLLINRAIERGLLQPAEVGSERIKISHLQYADDTLFVVEGSLENVKAIKWLLKFFELLSGLAVNFDKCRLFGINVSEEELTAMAGVLGCQKGSMPIDYLGMKVGGGLNKLFNWEGVVDRVRRKVSGWEWKRVSFGGKVTLIKSVLASIPIYRMAFSPIPVGTAETIRKMQSNFLWGSEEGGRKKIAWIKWKDICKNKSEGGLGVKNWRWFNVALLGKWIWRFVTQKNRLWVKVLQARHGGWDRWGLGGTAGSRRVAGVGWWRKITGVLNGELGEWFTKNLNKKVGDGMGTKFWEERWCGEHTLMVMFPRLYQLSANRDRRVGEMGRWINGEWRWELQWRRPLVDRDMERVEELKRALLHHELREGCDDIWCWGEKANGEYTVKDAYSFLSQERSGDERQERCSDPSVKIWRAVAPFKQQVVAWRIMRDRIPMRENLNKRTELSPEGSLCPCCAATTESTTHLLLQCNDMVALWGKMVDWVGTSWVAPRSLIDHFSSFSGLLGGKGMRRKLCGLWICIVWVIWRWRNKVIFENWCWDFRKMDEEIRGRFWSWCVSKNINGLNGIF